MPRLWPAVLDRREGLLIVSPQFLTCANFWVRYECVCIIKKSSNLTEDVLFCVTRRINYYGTDTNL